MPLAAIRLDIDQPLDVHVHILAEIAFHIALFFNDLTNAVDLVLAQILDLLERIDIRRHQNLHRPRIPDPVNVSKPDPRLLVPRQIDARNTCHTLSFIVPGEIPRGGYSGPFPYRSDESLTARLPGPELCIPSSVFCRGSSQALTTAN